MTAADEASAAVAAGVESPRGRFAAAVRTPGAAMAALMICALVSAQIILGSSNRFPASWNVHLADPVNRAQGWVRDNRLDHVVFRWIITPLSEAIRASLVQLESLLLWLPWFVVVAMACVLAARSRRVAPTLITGLAMLYLGAVGMWERSMETLALTIVSVTICVLLGLPLGVVLARRPRAAKVIRPLLDAMQTIPATVYLIPVVLVFGIGQVPAAIATVIFALPPMVRLTALGIEQVPATTVEAGRMFGSTPGQLLRKVQLPLAVPSIVAGINQTIMMALGIVVIGSLVGAGGLGEEVVTTLRLRSPGRGLVAGFAIVAIALVLDRVSRAFVEGRGAAGEGKAPRWRVVAIVAALVLATAAGRRFGWVQFPTWLDASIADPIDDAVLWIRDHTRGFTRALNDFIVRDVLIRLRDLLTDQIAWPVLVAATGALAWWAKGWKLALFAAGGLIATGMVGMWALAIETLVQVLVAVVISVAISVPLGLWVGRNRRAEQLIEPLLDAMQTIPSLIYAVPFVMLFTVSAVPGIIASVIYAVPAGVKVTALGIKQVEGEAVEASTSFGATPMQTMFGVRIPLALPSIVLAVNQVIMLVLSMIVIAGLVGGGALGFKSIEALTSSNTGLGAEVSVAIIAMTVILDRVTQAVADRFRVPT